MGFIFVTILLDIIGLGIIIPVAPHLIAELGHTSLNDSAPYVGWLGALYAVMQFIFAPIFGSLSDKYGRRPVILLALLGSGLDYVFMAFAATLPLVFLGRAISGISGASITAAQAYIADVSPPEKRAQNFGMIGMAFGLGFILGPLLGALLSTFGIRAPFIGAAVLTLANFLYGYFLLPESLKKENRREFSVAKANPVNTLVDLAKYPAVLGLVASLVLMNLAQGGLESVWVLYTGARYGWGPSQTGLSLAAVGLSAALVQGGLMRVLLPKLGEYRAIVYGVGISAISFIFYGLATKPWMIFVILIVGSLGGIGGPALQGFISRQVPATEQGLLSGALASVGSVTRIFSPLIATGLFFVFNGSKAAIQIPGAPFFFGAICLGISLFLTIRVMRNHVVLKT